MAGSIIAPNANMGVAGTPQAQTSQQTGGSAPFIRYARTASRTGYSYNNTSPFGISAITNPLAQAPGYLRYLNLTTAVSGNGGTGGVGAPDAPYNYFGYILFRDPWGTPILMGDGYRLLYLLRLYSGMAGLLASANTASLPSWSAIAATGAFQFRSTLPLEGARGYGVISIGSASLLPTLQLSTSASGTVYSTAPSALPNGVQLQVDESYYDVDPNNPVSPPGNGTTFQTSVITGNQQFSPNSSVKVQLPRTGGYLTSLILDVRDATGSRVDVWNSTGRVQLYIDGVPRFDESYAEMEDRIFELSGGTNSASRPAGVNVYDFKESLAQLNLGLLDTLETSLQTTSGTQLEIQMTPWGNPPTNANGVTPTAPFTLNATIVQIVPAGPLQRGLEEI